LVSLRWCTMMHGQSLYWCTMMHGQSLYWCTMMHGQSLYWCTVMHGQSLYWCTIRHGQQNIKFTQLRVWIFCQGPRYSFFIVLLDINMPPDEKWLHCRQITDNNWRLKFNLFKCTVYGMIILQHRKSQNLH
jgi:hypothetical protein